MASWRFQVVVDSVTLLLLIVIIALIKWIQTRGPRLTTSGPLPEDRQRYLAIGAPIGATLLTRLVGNRIQAGFLRSFETRLRSLEPSSAVDSRLLAGIRPPTRDNIQGLDRKWRGALGIDDLSEK